MLALEKDALRCEVERLFALETDLSKLLAALDRLLPRLLASGDEGLFVLGRGYKAWKTKDYAEAYGAWQEVQALEAFQGLFNDLLKRSYLLRPVSSRKPRQEPTSYQEAKVIPLHGLLFPNSWDAEAYTHSDEASDGSSFAYEDRNGRLLVCVDGSFSYQRRSAGVACVYKRPTEEGHSDIGFLARYLPPPVPDNHHAEAAALHLALTCPELSGRPLCLQTDSQTIYAALSDLCNARLSLPTLDLLAAIHRLLEDTDSRVIYRRSRTGCLLHSKADELAGWIAKFYSL